MSDSDIEPNEAIVPAEKEFQDHHFHDEDDAGIPMDDDEPFRQGPLIPSRKKPSRRPPPRRHYRED